ncbi:MAG TPA: DNA-3-methyladenine glycosylase [Bacteroidales bacterium]|nr:DNA-3-methyladenine glycosylase [Bacteroidales bacterium]
MDDTEALKMIDKSFYLRDVLEVAPDLLGKTIIRKWPSGCEERVLITETEAYSGMGDKACHASKGRTNRTEVMFMEGGILYMYLVYGMHWMLNVVTSVEDEPQAVLIRGLNTVNGPGRLTRFLELDKSFNREDLIMSDRISLYDTGLSPDYDALPRIGIDYAGEYWKNKPWRFVMK